MIVEQCIQDIQRLVESLREGTPELTEGMIRIDNSMASVMTNQNLHSLYRSFHQSAENIHEAINHARDIFQDYEDDNGNDPDVKEFFGPENLRKLIDAANFVEAFAATFENASRKAKK